MTPLDTKDKVAIVTGAASGIGAATAQHLAALGWRVALIDRDAAGLERSVAALRESGAHALAGAADVTDQDAVENALAGFAALGPLKGVVNCAGVVANVPVDETTSALLRSVLDINVVGTFVVMQAALPRLRAAGGGAIVNLSSIAGMRGVTGRTAYSASKAAVIGMSRVWASELATQGIRVNVVAPGPVETPMVKAAHTTANRQALLAAVPMRRYAQPEEIASAIAFLLDEKAASYVTGHVLAVDGGYMAGAGV